MMENKHEELIQRIAVAREKDFSEENAHSIIVELKKVPFKSAAHIVDMLCLRESLPRNIYGAICAGVREANRESEKAVEQQDMWRANDEDRVSPKEWRAFWKCMVEIMWYHHYRWIKANPNPVLDCENRAFLSQYNRAWDSGVFPPTHSDLADKFIKEYRDAYTADLSDGKSLLAFLVRFNVKYRQNRTTALSEGAQKDGA